MARHRKAMNGAKDRRMFNVTARKTKTINLSQKPMRGGIRKYFMRLKNNIKSRPYKSLRSL